MSNIVQKVLQRVVQRAVQPVMGGYGVIFPPYLNDLFPLLPKKTPCGIGSAAGGRLLDYTKGVDIIDSIGDETRPVQLDYCVKNDGIGGHILYPYNVYSEWAFGFKVANVTNKYYVTSNGATGKLGFGSFTGHFGFRSSTMIYKWDGSGNTIVVPTESVDYQDGFLYTDGIDIHLYINGVYKGYITPDNTDLSIYLMVSAYDITYQYESENYDYRLYDLSTRTPQEINDYFNEHACKWTIDNMPDDDNFKYHHWAMQEKEGTAIWDSGTVAEADKIHGTLFYDDANVPSVVPRGTTLMPRNIRNNPNRYGSNKVAYFNGVNSYIEYPTKFNSGAFTLIIKSYRAFADGKYSLRIGGLEFASRNNFAYPRIYLGGSDLYFNTLTEYNSGNAVFVAYRYNGGMSLKIDVNGASESKVYGSAVDLSAYDLNIGGAPIGYNGLIQSTGVLLYPTYLSDADITLIRNNEEVAGATVNDPLNGSTIGTPTNIDWDKINIPNDRAVAGKDIFGRDSLTSGIAKLNAKVVGGMVGEFDGSSYIQMPTFKRLNDTGLKWEGILKESNRAIVGNSGSGYYSNVLIKDEYIYIESNTNGNITLVYSIGLLNSYHTFELIPNGSYNFDIYIDEVFIETTTGLTDFIDINQIGTAGGDIRPYVGSIAYVRLGNDIYYLNGHTINSIDGVAATNNGVTFAPITEGTTQATEDSMVSDVIKRGVDLIVAPKFTPLPTDVLLKGKGYKGAGKIDYAPNSEDSSKIGHLPHLIFNTLCYNANPFNLPNWLDASILLINDIDNPAVWDEEMKKWAREHPEYIDEEIRGQLYDFFDKGCGTVLTHTAVYPNPMTSFEQDKINKSGGCPTYTI